MWAPAYCRHRLSLGRWRRCCAVPAGALFEVIDCDDLWFPRQRKGWHTLTGRRAMHGKLLERTLEPGSLEWLRAGPRRRESRIIMGHGAPERAGVQVEPAPVRGESARQHSATDAAGPRPLPRNRAIRGTGGGRSTPRQGGTHGTWVHPEDSRFLAPRPSARPPPPATSRCWRSDGRAPGRLGRTGLPPYYVSTRRSGRWVFWGTSRSRGRPDGVPGVRLPGPSSSTAAVVRDGSRGDRVPGLTARR